MAIRRFTASSAFAALPIEREARAVNIIQKIAIAKAASTSKLPLLADILRDCINRRNYG